MLYRQAGLPVFARSQSRARQGATVQHIECAVNIQASTSGATSERTAIASCFVHETTDTSSSAIACPHVVISPGEVSNGATQDSAQYHQVPPWDEIDHRLVVSREALTSNHGHDHVREPRLDPHHFQIAPAREPPLLSARNQRCCHGNGVFLLCVCLSVSPKGLQHYVSPNQNAFVHLLISPR